MYARNFARSVAWKFDQDYLDKLTPEELEWLSDFNRRFYNADFTGDPRQEWSDAERRAAYRAKNAANRDVYTAAGVTALSSRTNLVSEGTDQSPRPRYLETPTYKTALSVFRDVVCTSTKKDVHPLAASAKTRLEKITMANKDTKKPITVTQQDFAPTTTPTTTTAVSTATNPITKLGLDDEQGFRAMALVPVRTGYAVVWVKLLGRHVVDAEILTEGVVPRHHAEDVFRVEASNRIINGGRDADEV